MAITIMSIGVPPVNRFTVAARALSKCGRTPAMDAGWMEKVMNIAINVADRELTTAELELVAGGHDTGDDIIVGVFAGFGFLAGLATYETSQPVGYLKAGLHKY
jgi:hypothetical protein